MIKRLLKLALVLAVIIFSGFADAMGVTPLTDFTISRYLGNWYEIARLPNRFHNYDESSTATWLKNQGFNNIKPDIYWSSTPKSTDNPSAWNGYVWSISLNNGILSAKNSLEGYYVWPVRGGR
jgi:hypothetical protein